MLVPTSTPQILVVDDDVAVGKVLVSLLQQGDSAAEHVMSAEEALERLGRRAFDLILSDLRMAGMDGMALLRKVRALWPDIPFVLISAHGTVPLAVEAMRRGAADFLLKPFDREELAFTIRKALAQGGAQEPPPPDVEERLVSQAPAMREIEALIRKAGASPSTVLIRGESGTGKERVAQALHAASARKNGPFVAVHCAALPEALLESELFGYEKGAFSGAVSRKPGRIDLAQGGTLFLDEIGDISPATQVKLLRLLQEKTFERLGGTETLRADVRFVAATHQPLEDQVRTGRFREDLFYRLNVVPIWLPPLRERTEDIGPLAEHATRALAKTHGRPALTLERGAIDALRAEPWPGNVRQLQNFLERLVIFADHDLLTREDVEREVQRQKSPGDLRPHAAPAPSGTLESQRLEVERRALEDALQRARGNRTLAARLLGVSRRTLYNKLEEHGLA
jgi:two-component system response regulator AtoC